MQILSLKNQIDPHYTFNILNSLGHLYTNSDLKERSYELFVKYSRLLRQSVESSDRITVSRREELDFVRTCVELEQLRSHPPFRYNLAVGDEVDQDRTIPRMLIHTFVENSIKHGIHGRCRETPGELGIHISAANGQTTILIRDNGPCLHTEAHQFSTGKGLKIIDELIGLFTSLEGVKIRYSMKDRISDEGSVEAWKSGSTCKDNCFHYLGTMDILDFSPHIFWSYDRGADIEPEVVIRQVIAYGEVRDMLLLNHRIDRNRILEVIGSWKGREKHDKQIHFFKTVILEANESGI